MSGVVQKIKDNPKKAGVTVLLILIGIGALVGIAFGIYAAVQSHSTHTSGIQLTNQVKKSNKTLTALQNQIFKIKTAQRAAQEQLTLNKGSRGPSGPKGDVGGVYKEKGYLHSIKHGPNMAVDRYYATGVNSKAFINTKTFGATSQGWTFTNDGVLENKYDGCLYGNPKTNEVYMMNNCKDGTGKGKWITDPKGGKLMWKHKPHLCLAVGGKTRSTTQTIKNGKPVSGETQYATLKLQKCDQNNPGHQVWTFS